MEPSEIVALVGVFVGAVLAGLVGYFRRSPQAKADHVLTGVGLEFGNRQQMDQLIAAVNRLGDIIENRRTAGIEDMLRHLVDAGRIKKIDGSS